MRFNRLCLAVWAAPCVCAPVFVVRHTLTLFVRHPTGRGVTLTLFACHPPVVCVCNLDAVVTPNCVAASAMIRQDEYLSSLGMSFEGASEGGNNGGALSTPLPPFVLFGLVVPPWLFLSPWLSLFLRHSSENMSTVQRRSTCIAWSGLAGMPATTRRSLRPVRDSRRRSLFDWRIYLFVLAARRCFAVCA